MKIPGGKYGNREKQYKLVRSSPVGDLAKCLIHKTNIKIETPWHDFFIKTKTSPRVEIYKIFLPE